MNYDSFTENDLETSISNTGLFPSLSIQYKTLANIVFIKYLLSNSKIYPRETGKYIVIKNCIFNNCSFDNISIELSSFIDCEFNNCSFSYMNGSNSDFSFSKFVACVFESSDFSSAIFLKSEFSKIKKINKCSFENAKNKDTITLDLNYPELGVKTKIFPSFKEKIPEEVAYKKVHQTKYQDGGKQLVILRWITAFSFFSGVVVCGFGFYFSRFETIPTITKHISDASVNKWVLFFLEFSLLGTMAFGLILFVVATKFAKIYTTHHEDAMAFHRETWLMSQANEWRSDKEPTNSKWAGRVFALLSMNLKSKAEPEKDDLGKDALSNSKEILKLLKDLKK